MPALNSISQHKSFQRSGLSRPFEKSPLGFIDVGAAGGICPLIMPFACLTHCTCFEPDKRSYEHLLRKYAQENPFSKMTLFNTAVGGGALGHRLHLTKSPVNTSLRTPNSELSGRYHKDGFRCEGISSVKTKTLDRIVFENRRAAGPMAEFIKLDCQGAEYDVLKGGVRALREQCVALVCEVEFFRMYRGQKTFSEIDLFLEREGFCLYGLYPHYISAQKINRKEYDTEERLLWADAVYFKDPLDSVNKKKKFSSRQVQALLLAALLTRFYDYSLEILDRYYSKDRKVYAHIKELVLSLAEGYKKGVETDLDVLSQRLRRTPGKRFLLAKKFIDAHKANNNIDLIAL